MSSFFHFLFTAVFLPGLIKPEECKSKDGTLNKPICIAWSSVGRNHYISLVGIKGRYLRMKINYLVYTSLTE